LGIPEEDAWIFIHSPDQAHTSLYTENYAAKVISDHPDKPGQKVLIARLPEFRDAVEANIHLTNTELKHLFSASESIHSFRQNGVNIVRLKDHRINFRDFKKYLELEQVAPTTFTEYNASQDGAQALYRNTAPSYLMLRKQDQPGVLTFYKRMFNFFQGPHANPMPKWMETRSYLKSRYMMEKALVIDDFRANPFQDEVNWDQVLRQAVDYAKANDIKTIALSGWDELDPKLGLRFRGATREPVYHTTEAARLYDPNANSWFSIFWLNVDALDHSLQGVAPAPALKRSQQFWSEPLFSL
jgi:hypothetical protein